MPAHPGQHHRDDKGFQRALESAEHFELMDHIHRNAQHQDARDRSDDFAPRDFARNLPSRSDQKGWITLQNASIPRLRVTRDIAFMIF